MKCTAHSSQTGKPCKKDAIKGTNVCRSHGGAAPQVRNMAKARLLGWADATAAHLIALIEDDDEDSRVRLAAINSLLDRAGITYPKQLEISVEDARSILDAEIIRLEQELGVNDPA